MCVCFPHMYICISHVCLVPREVTDPLELELWMVVTHVLVLGFKPSSSSRVASALKREPPFSPKTFAQHTRAEKRPGGSLKLEHSVWHYQCLTGSLSQKLRNELGALQLTKFQTLTKKWKNTEKKSGGKKKSNAVGVLVLQWGNVAGVLILQRGGGGRMLPVC